MPEENHKTLNQENQPPDRKSNLVSPGNEAEMLTTTLRSLVTEDNPLFRCNLLPCNQSVTELTVLRGKLLKMHTLNGN